MTVIFTNHLETLRSRFWRQQDACLATARKLARRSEHTVDTVDLEDELRRRFDALDATKRALRKLEKSGASGLQRGRA